ncbi:hypothetical protein VNI00_014597 [Paramarasmius palmivorus]|uniref:Uncharacterized protein n=1 Tax=Paramarasmius palmivorus TaxID=297713 RepID=A0AAW0BSK0_9AGAR
MSRIAFNDLRTEMMTIDASQAENAQGRPQEEIRGRDKETLSRGVIVIGASRDVETGEGLERSQVA